MKVIFLDVDGVLNCLYCKVKIDGFFFVMDEKIELLKQLVDRTGAKVVLTSTWRQGWIDQKMGLNTRDATHYEALQDKLLEFNVELLDHTPISPGNIEKRGEEIDLWLKEWDGEQIESFVILDDMSGRYLRPYSNRLVNTSFTDGLLQKHVEWAVKILNKLRDEH